MIFLKSLNTFLCFSCHTNFLKKYSAKSSITQGNSTVYNVLIDLLDTFNIAPHPFESNKIIQKYNREIMFILNELVLGFLNFENFKNKTTCCTVTLQKGHRIF